MAPAFYCFIQNREHRNRTVHLLNDDDKYKEDHSFKRRCQKDKQRTWDGSDIWSKKWDDIGYADEYTDQRRVWNIRNTESNKGNDRYNDRVNDLSTEKLGKRPVNLFSEKIVYKRRFAWAQNRSFPAIR